MNVHSGGSEATPIHSGWDLEGVQGGGICPMGSTAQNQAPYFALEASNFPQQ